MNKVSSPVISSIALFLILAFSHLQAEDASGFERVVIPKCSFDEPTLGVLLGTFESEGYKSFLIDNELYGHQIKGYKIEAKNIHLEALFVEVQLALKERGIILTPVRGNLYAVSQSETLRMYYRNAHNATKVR